MKKSLLKKNFPSIIHQKKVHRVVYHGIHKDIEPRTKTNVRGVGLILRVFQELFKASTPNKFEVSLRDTKLVDYEMTEEDKDNPRRYECPSGQTYGKGIQETMDGTGEPPKSIVLGFAQCHPVVLEKVVAYQMS